MIIIYFTKNPKIIYNNQGLTVNNILPIVRVYFIDRKLRLILLRF